MLLLLILLMMIGVVVGMVSVISNKPWIASIGLGLWLAAFLIAALW